MICRRKPCCLLLSPGATKTWSCINIHLWPVLGNESHPFQDKGLWTEPKDSHLYPDAYPPSRPPCPSQDWKEGPHCFVVPWLTWQATIKENLFWFFVLHFLHQELATSLQIMVVPEKQLLSGHSQLVLGQGRRSYWASALMYLACPGLMFIFISDTLLWVSLNVSSR